MLFLHVFDWPTSGKLLVPGLKSKVGSAVLLDGRKPLAYKNTSKGVEITVPTKAPNEVSTTIQLMVKGGIDIEQPELVLKLGTALTLHPEDATLHGGIQSEERGGEPNLGFWTDPGDYADWTFIADKAGTVNVKTEVAGTSASSFSVAIGGTKNRFVAPSTGSYEAYQAMDLGVFPVAAGKNTLVLRAIAENWKPINVRAIKITRVP
jgi:alpha-L-fucosidase